MDQSDNIVESVKKCTSCDYYLLFFTVFIDPDPKPISLVAYKSKGVFVLKGFTVANWKEYFNFLSVVDNVLKVICLWVALVGKGSVYL